MEQVNVLALLVGAALALLCIAIVVYPFLKARSRTPAQASRNGVGPEAPDLEAVYEAIRTLQLEHQLGNVPDGLYREQLQGYRLQAASVLRQQMEAQTADPEWLLEQEVLVAREAQRRPEGGPESDGSVKAADR